MATPSEPPGFQKLSRPFLSNDGKEASLELREPPITCVYSTYNRTFNLPLSEASPMHKRSSKLYTTGTTKQPNANIYTTNHCQDTRFGHEDSWSSKEKANQVKIRKSIISLPIRPPPAQLQSLGSHLRKIDDEKSTCISVSPSLRSMYNESDRGPPLTSQILSKAGNPCKENNLSLTRAWDFTTTIFDSHTQQYGGNDKHPVDTEWSSHESINIPEKKRLRCKRCGFRRFWKAIRDKFPEHIDVKVFLEMIDVRHIFWPFAIWKYTVLLGVAVIITGIVLSQHYTKWMEKSMSITRSNMLPILILVLALEPIMISIVLLVVRIPRLDPEYSMQCTDTEANSVILNESKNVVSFSESTQSITEKVGIENVAERTNGLNCSAKEMKHSEAASLDVKDPNHRTALVIPCHNSDRDAMRKVLESAYQHFRPQDIYIVDNGHTNYPPDDFRAWMGSQHPDIVYIWSPIGSKNCAQLVGALACRNYDFIMTVDGMYAERPLVSKANSETDDVSIPRNFKAPIDKIDDVTKVLLSRSARSMRPENRCSFW
jgi:DNA-directed RNA polymerase subunit RPC12/RpoP